VFLRLFQKKSAKRLLFLLAVSIDLAMGQDQANFSGATLDSFILVHKRA
jgi:hypothetical protein